MTSPDPNADAASNKYHVQIGEGKYIVIGDQAHLSPEGEPHVDLTAAEETYRQRVVDTYNWLDFSPDSSLTPEALQDVFVRLALIVEKVIRVPVSVERTSQAKRGEPRQQEQEVTIREPIELDKALSNHLLIVGDPGAGKSTLLRWLAVTFASERQQESDRLGPSADSDRLPVLVELGRLPKRYLQPESGETPNWLEFLPHEYLSRQTAFTNTPPQLLVRALAEGRCLLLFDGLDEVANHEARGRLADSLAELARLFPGNRVVIGSRPAGVSVSEHKLRRQFQRCEIQHFTPEDVRRFFRFWYALDQNLTAEQQRDEADALFADVQATPATLQLATTPLLCAMLVQIGRKEGALPKRRVKLYEDCCRNLIEQWETGHRVEYQGVLANMHWEKHLDLLAPLAYVIHSRGKPTSATRKELAPTLAHTLQAKKGYTERDAEEAADQFLDALSLRSGLLQYKGNDTYGFPHLTFQEYLAARHIAARPDPEYIDLLMEHLHEAWWQQVHLLTIGHLGSGKEGASKASALILTILHVYAPPSLILRPSRNHAPPSLILRPKLENMFILILLTLTNSRNHAPLSVFMRPSRNHWLSLIGPGRLLPQVQLERRIAWILAREFELIAKGYAECEPDGTTAKVGTVLSAQAASLVRHLIYDWARREAQEDLLTVIYQSLQRQGNEAVVSTLREALHDADPRVRERAVEILGQVGGGNEEVVSALLEALHDADWYVRVRVVESLGQMEVGNEEVVSALLEALHDADPRVQERAAESLGQVGGGNKAVVSALLEALHDAYPRVRERAAESLGYLEIKDTIQLYQVLVALNRCLYDLDEYARRAALESIRQLLDGRQLPGYCWVSLQKRRAWRLGLKRIAFWLVMTAVMVMIGLAATWLLGALDPNGFLVRFLAVLAGIVALVAAVTQVLGRTLRDPWEHS